jgi:hypothetical protein
MPSLPFEHYNPEDPLKPIPPEEALDGRTPPEVLPVIIGNTGLNPEKSS